MKFVNMISDIRAMASNMAGDSSGFFEPDELVNEAWIKSEKDYNRDPPYIMKRAKMDMIDYMRSVRGKKGSSRRDYLQRTFYISNLDDTDDNVLDKLLTPCYDRGIEIIEKRDVLMSIIEKIDKKDIKDMKLLVDHVINGNTMSEIGKSAGINASSACYILKRIKAKSAKAADSCGVLAEEL